MQGTLYTQTLAPAKLHLISDRHWLCNFPSLSKTHKPSNLSALPAAVKGPPVKLLLDEKIRKLNTFFLLSSLKKDVVPMII